MSRIEDPRSSARGQSLRRVGACVLFAISGLAGLQGCTESDGFMLDQSKIGRWERTPTSVPILNRIASIEGPQDEFVEESEVSSQDLIPEVTPYRIGPGDALDITIWHLPAEGDVTPYQRLVDSRGTIELPQIGSVTLSGLTTDEAVGAVGQAMRDAQLVSDPVLDISLRQQRELRYSVIGAVQTPGPYLIPEADYRLLEALTAAGGFAETADTIYVIRQIPLSARAKGEDPSRPATGAGQPVAPTPRPSGEQLIDIIDDLTAPSKPASPSGSPAVIGLPPRQPAAGQPPIDLVEPGGTPRPAGATPPEGETAWMFLNGEWVRVARAAAGAPEASGKIGDRTPEQLVTQRVIKVPVQPLIAGDARYNVVIRPGDVIRVPPEPGGNFFVGGEVVRVGVYQMGNKITLTKAIIAAGGLSAIAIPERVDLTRMVGENREATIRLNLRAIAEGTHPNIFLKPNDQINVGTNFWATPLAIIRNGFRATYGFGFLLDRNFGPDVFGPEPVNRIF